MSRIRDVFAAQGNRGETVLIAFLMAGMPDEDTCLKSVKALEEAGCDLLELGVPFTDPVADGVIIERFHHRGVEQGWNLQRTLSFAGRIKEVSDLPLILFSYYNPVLQMPAAQLAEQCRAVGVEGLIVPDLPLHEMRRLTVLNLEPIPMVAPSSTTRRLQMAAQMNPAFVYCVSVLGVTGLRNLPENELRCYVRKVREVTKCPLAVGFGISEPRQVQRCKELAEGVVVGSGLAQIMQECDRAAVPDRIGKLALSLKEAGRKGGEIR